MSALAASAKGASVLILLQVATRASTFAVNQVLLRYVSPELLGLEAQLALYSITVLYFSRESVRVAVQRQPDQTGTVVNMAYISILLGTPLAAILAFIYLKAAPNTPYFTSSLAVYAGSCVVQLFTEPAFVASQQKLLFGIRASAEGLGTVIKSLITCIAVIWARRNGHDIGVLPFALGDFAYAFARFFAYLIAMWPIATKDGFSMLPRRIYSKDDVPQAERYMFSLFSKSLTTLSGSLWVQNSFKYVLTQGDSILIAALTSLRDQGAYALASNYGGLVARMLFQPIEESSRNLIAKVCSPDPSTGKPTSKGLNEAKRLLSTILKLYNIIGLFAISLGPTAAPHLLRIVAGSRWADTEAGNVLAVYCYYIPFLAINGLTEAFVAAVASNSELGSQSLSMGMCFAAFAGSAYLFLHEMKLGAIGLVFANCVNMALRIIFNIRFITKFFRNNGQTVELSSTLPSISSIACGVATAAILHAGPYTDSLLVAAMHTLALAAVVVFIERDYLMYCYKTLR